MDRLAAVGRLAAAADLVVAVGAGRVAQEGVGVPALATQDVEEEMPGGGEEETICARGHGAVAWVAVDAAV